MKMFTARCKNASTANGLENLLVTGNNSTSCRSNSRIRNQTTSAARRKAIKEMQNRILKTGIKSKRNTFENFKYFDKFKTAKTFNFSFF